MGVGFRLVIVGVVRVGLVGAIPLRPQRSDFQKVHQTLTVLFIGEVNGGSPVVGAHRVKDADPGHQQPGQQQTTCLSIHA